MGALAARSTRQTGLETVVRLHMPGGYALMDSASRAAFTSVSRRSDSRVFFGQPNGLGECVRSLSALTGPTTSKVGTSQPVCARMLASFRPNPRGCLRLPTCWAPDGWWARADRAGGSLPSSCRSPRSGATVASEDQVKQAGRFVLRDKSSSLELAEALLSHGAWLTLDPGSEEPLHPPTLDT